MDFGFPDFPGNYSVDWKFCLWSWNYLVVIFCGLFWVGNEFSLVWDILQVLSAHFPVLGLSRNRGSAAQIFTKLYFYLISNRLSKIDL
ncbi:skin secretory protein xP2-like [Iris pallida]|uniref:Skin secretory protein xP2-like n=1 Tax=Iris pallida TaxID=29817 RepID=A0AAX6EKK0_IRIPA|nr:skin secretory protein xP2-like [Iris pallida]KAJ6804470.1 skin secretory protein xP2-like [Iris pallida]